MDKALTEEGLKTRIVFIAYVDTIWAPLEEKIENHDRFTMLFAPIHRSYAYSLPEKSDYVEWFTRETHEACDTVELSLPPRAARIFIRKDIWELAGI
jgi:hypothetical protein